MDRRRSRNAKTCTNEPRLRCNNSIPRATTVFNRLPGSLISFILTKVVFPIACPICPTMDKPFSSLIALPKELRLEIWEYLLSPKVDETTWHNSEIALCVITRKCLRRCPKRYSRIYPQTLQFFTSKVTAHYWDDGNCECHTEPFAILNSKEKLCPAILCVNRLIYDEALPCLYRQRMFAADGNKYYSTVYDGLADSWFLLYRFLSKISNEARSQVRCISIPMLLSQFEVYGCHEPFSRYVNSQSKFQFSWSDL